MALACHVDTIDTPLGAAAFVRTAESFGAVKYLAHFPIAPQARHPVRLPVQQRRVRVAAGAPLAPVTYIFLHFLTLG